MYVMVPKTGQKCMDYMHWDGDEELMEEHSSSLQGLLIFGLCSGDLVLVEP